MKDELVEIGAKVILATRHPFFPWEDAPEVLRDQYRVESRAYLSAIESAGLVIVPREADQTMLEEGSEGVAGNYGGCCQPGDNIKTAKDVWSAMLAASPKHL